MSENGFSYEDFFEVSPDIFAIADTNGHFIKLNKAATQILGYTKEELYAKPFIEFIHPEDQERTANTDLYFKDNEVLYDFENRYITKSGDTVWLAWTSKFSRRDQLFYATAKNITYKKVVELDKDLLIANLKEKNQSYKKLTYTTAHDLRSPVDSLLSIFTLMDMDEIKSEKNKKLLSLFNKGTEQLKGKLNEYIDHLSANQKIEVEIEKVCFQNCLNKVMEDIHNLVKTSKLEIETDFKEAECIQFNYDYMHSIFLNLLSNAIKYAKEDAKPMVKIKTATSDDFIYITFSDNGIGIDMEKAKGKIFGLHQTFQNNPEAKGIGLYLVYTHISSFGGNISVESELGKGTTFKIAIPNKFA